MEELLRRVSKLEEVVTQMAKWTHFSDVVDFGILCTDVTADKLPTSPPPESDVKSPSSSKKRIRAKRKQSFDKGEGNYCGEHDATEEVKKMYVVEDTVPFPGLSTPSILPDNGTGDTIVEEIEEEFVKVEDYAVDLDDNDHLGEEFRCVDYTGAEHVPDSMSGSENEDNFNQDFQYDNASGLRTRKSLRKTQFRWNEMKDLFLIEHVSRLKPILASGSESRKSWYEISSLVNKEFDTDVTDLAVKRRFNLLLDSHKREESFHNRSGLDDVVRDIREKLDILANLSATYKLQQNNSRQELLNKIR
ncbi:uncharacterized protein LOC110857460 isoform X2 [Folsomia candida]|uniref:uncharacterized protein LOC110857460 isoform X2 n=1 Tax=Folsomia candida TaxID=158441 RepID=UPI000B8F6E5A|nr:uncharacterized protein LOC110857460 isoform X2 [Folsomia candida]